MISCATLVIISFFLFASYAYSPHCAKFFFFFNDPAPTEISTLSLHDALPILRVWLGSSGVLPRGTPVRVYVQAGQDGNLIVLHRRTDGRIEVLFPGKPSEDPFVRAGTYEIQDRKSTRLNSSHGYISYAVFCLK